MNRRRLLATLGLSPLALVGTRAVEGSLDSAASFQVEEPESIPENNPSPLLPVNHTNHALQEQMGWEDADRSQVVKELLRLGPDLVNELDLTGFTGPPLDTVIARRHQVVRDFAYKYQLPYVLGVHYNLHDGLNSEWYQNLPEDDMWRYPDGSLVEEPRDAVGEDFHGESWEMTPSIFVDGVEDRLSRSGRQIFEFGANQFWIDSPIQPSVDGLDFSPAAQDAFRDYLLEEPESKLDSLEISDPDEFDVRKYLTDTGLSPGDTDAPATDAVFREYVLFQMREMLRFVQTVFDDARAGLSSELADAGTSVFGLGFELQYDFLNPACIAQSDNLDVISIELNPSVPPQTHELSYKIGRAAGRFEKPVRAWGRMTEDFGTTADLDTEGYYPTLMQFQSARGYASGGVRSIPITGLPDKSYDEMVNCWMRPDGKISDSMHEFVDFVRANQRFLRDVNESNNAVLAVSLSTLLWHRLPNWGRRQTMHSEALGEAALVLREAHIPYDVVILDHPSLWEAESQITRLEEYDLIVLPGVECVADSHVSAIESAIDNGATVIATGGMPARDVTYKPRDDLAQLVEEAENGFVLDDDPNTDANSRSADALREILSDTSHQLELSVDEDVFINVFEQESPDRVIVHLLNYMYDSDTDSMTELENFQLTLSDPSLSPAKATYYTVNGVQPLELETDSNAATVTVPSLNVWGFIVFGDTEADTSSDTAEKHLADAKSRLNRVELENEDAVVQLASAKIEQAEQAMEYESYGVVAELASDALSLLSDTEKNSGEGNESPNSSEDNKTGNEDETPGFGAITSLTALGIYYLLTCRGTNDENKSE